MPFEGNQTPPSVKNYEIGGMFVVMNGVDLGNIVSAEVNPQDITVVQHFTARSGERKLDDQRVVQKRLFWRFDLDEHQADIYAKYFMAKKADSDPSKILVSSQPLSETNIVVTYKDGGGNTIWTYSHSRGTTRPSAAMNFGEFNNYVRFGVEFEALEDPAQLVGSEVAAFGVIDFS